MDAQFIEVGDDAVPVHELMLPHMDALQQLGLLEPTGRAGYWRLAPGKTDEELEEAVAVLILEAHIAREDPTGWY